MKQLRNIERKWLQSLGTVLVGNCPYCDAVVKLTGVSVTAESERCDACGETFRIDQTPVDELSGMEELLAETTLEGITNAAVNIHETPLGELPELAELLAATTLDSIANAAINQAKLPTDVLYPSLIKYLDLLRAGTFLSAGVSGTCCILAILTGFNPERSAYERSGFIGIGLVGLGFVAVLTLASLAAQSFFELFVSQERASRQTAGLVAAMFLRHNKTDQQSE